MKRFLAGLLVFLYVLGCVSCNGNNLPTDTDPTETHTESETLEKPSTPPAGEENNEPVELALKWNFGYVASSSHSTTPSQLVENGDCYSYTDVFTVVKAGTTISFMDDNTNSNGDTRFATANAYVVSSWIERDGEWVLDRYGFNYAGDTSTDSKIVASSENGMLLYTYTTTLDNEHLRLCFRSGQRSNFTPAAFPTVVSEYTGNRGTGEDKLALKQWIEGTKKDYYNSALDNLTINALGDSLFAGQGLPQEQIWLHLLGAKYNMDMTNYGIGGNTMSSVASNPMCERYTQMKDNAPDIIFLEGGANDYNKQVQIGASGSKDTKTFIGALNVTIDGLQKKYPGAMIVVISQWDTLSSNGAISLGEQYKRKDYVDAMREVAAEQGVYFIDAFNSENVGLNMKNDAFRAKYCIKPTDINHLNSEGMKLVMPKFEKMIADCYTDFLSKKLEIRGTPKNFV